MNQAGEAIKIAVLLRTARTAIGWNQQEFADLMGVAKSTVARVETLEVGAKAEFLSKALSLFQKEGVRVSLSDDLMVQIGATALIKAQQRLEDDANRRSDRKRSGTVEKAASDPAASEVESDPPNNLNDPQWGTW